MWALVSLLAVSTTGAEPVVLLKLERIRNIETASAAAMIDEARRGIEGSGRRVVVALQVGDDARPLAERLAAHAATELLSLRLVAGPTRVRASAKRLDAEGRVLKEAERDLIRDAWSPGLYEMVHRMYPGPSAVAIDHPSALPSEGWLSLALAGSGVLAAAVATGFAIDASRRSDGVVSDTDFTPEGATRVDGARGAQVRAAWSAGLSVALLGAGLLVAMWE